MALNSENYYTNEADWQYQSPTWFKMFQACEAATLAQLKGDWNPKGNPKSLLVGNYVHSYFESLDAHNTFIEQNSDKIYKKGNELRAEFVQADKMIHALETDNQFNAVYQGDKEVIVTGEIDGVRWKGKLDCLPENKKYFVDIKTTEDIHKAHWLPNEHRRGSFIQAYNYTLQMAVYQELIKQQFGVIAVPLIQAVSKQDPPDKEQISIPQSELDYALAEVKAQQEHVEAVKNGQLEPVRCGHCEYCRANKQQHGIISMYELID